MSTLTRCPFELSIAFQTNKTPAEYRALAVQADTHGFDVVSVYNDLFFQPALGPLLWMAPYLTRARLGPAALNPFTTHPVEIAGQIALLDLATQGHAYLGLVRGSWLDAVGLHPRGGLGALREALLAVRYLLAGRTEGLPGTHFPIAPGAKLQYAPVRSDPPVMVGTWGTRTAELAGELADEVKIGGSTNPAMLGVLRPAIDAGSARAGRAPGTVRLCLGAVTVVDEDRQAARTLARREVALYLGVVAPLDPTTNDPEWVARVRGFASAGDYEAVSRDISDEMLDRFAFSGTPGDVLRQVETIRAAGAARVEFGTPHGITTAEGMRLLGEKVLPGFQR